MKKGKWVWMVLGILLAVCLTGSFLVIKKQNSRDLVSQDASEKTDDSGEKSLIYGRISDGNLAAENEIKALEGDPYFGLEREEFQTAWNYIRAYEKKDIFELKGMLSEGVEFDYKAYFASMEKNISHPLVRISGFYDYETETACVCEVTGRKKAENGEEVYDLENTFRMTFSLLPDGSIMPYSDQAGRLGDPYLSDGLIGNISDDYGYK